MDSDFSNSHFESDVISLVSSSAEFAPSYVYSSSISRFRYNWDVLNHIEYRFSSRFLFLERHRIPCLSSQTRSLCIPETVSGPLERFVNDEQLLRSTRIAGVLFWISSGPLVIFLRVPGVVSLMIPVRLLKTVYLYLSVFSNWFILL